MPSVRELLGYLDEVQARTLRDVMAIPESALGFRPPQGGDDEATWAVGRIVGHVAGARLRFATAFASGEWIVPVEPEVGSLEGARSALERSGREVTDVLASAGEERLAAEIVTATGRLTGWRVLMMMVEHEVHHRSQLDAYASFGGWRAPQIFGRRWEEVIGLE